MISGDESFRFGDWWIETIGAWLCDAGTSLGLSVFDFRYTGSGTGTGVTPEMVCLHPDAS